MSINAGKQFESQFKKSIPDTVLLIRLNDSAQAFKKSEFAKFTPKNPCDFFAFDTLARKLYAIECKSTKYKSISFEDVDSNKKQNKMIHAHQIESLTKFSKYDGVIGCFVFNFRDEKNNVERTYYQDIEKFNQMIHIINKKSFDEIDLIKNGAIKINGNRKRLYYIWSLNELFEKLGGK